MSETEDTADREVDVGEVESAELVVVDSHYTADDGRQYQRGASITISSEKLALYKTMKRPPVAPVDSPPGQAALAGTDWPPVAKDLDVVRRGGDIPMTADIPIADIDEAERRPVDRPKATGDGDDDDDQRSPELEVKLQSLHGLEGDDLVEAISQIDASSEPELADRLEHLATLEGEALVASLAEIGVTGEADVADDDDDQSQDADLDAIRELKGKAYEDAIAELDGDQLMDLLDRETRPAQVKVIQARVDALS